MAAKRNQVKALVNILYIYIYIYIYIQYTYICIDKYYIYELKK